VTDRAVSAPEAAVDLAARVVHRDRFVLVLDKPAGLAVHAGPATPDSLDDHLAALAFDRRTPPAPAHRLDRDTSGCLVLGRTPGALKRLQRGFAQGRIVKTYLARTHGRPPAERGRIDRPLAKVSSKAAGWRMVAERARPDAKPAVTDWRVVDADDAGALVELRPRTGRTHQLRAHLAWLGCPILGDPVYGPADAADGPMRLHALRVEIPPGLADPDGTSPPIRAETLPPW
jgi:RluA family pseudouridine synthase